MTLEESQGIPIGNYVYAPGESSDGWIPKHDSICPRRGLLQGLWQVVARGTTGGKLRNRYKCPECTYETNNILSLEIEFLSSHHQVSLKIKDL